MPNPAGPLMKSKPLWMPRMRMFSSVLENRYAPAANTSPSTSTWYSKPRKALLRQDQERLLGGAAAINRTGFAHRRNRSRCYRTGGAYMKPPLLHRPFAPRGSLSADFGP